MTYAITNWLTAEAAYDRPLASFARMCARLVPESGVGGYEPLTDAPLQAVSIERIRAAEDDVRMWKDKLTTLEAMGETEARAKLGEFREQAIAIREEHAQWKARAMGRLRAIAAMAETWEPPTTGHVVLKNCMMREIKSAAEYVESVAGGTGCDLVDPDEWRVWLDHEIEDARDAIVRKAKILRRLVEEQKTCGAWVAALEESLKSAP